MTQLFFLIFLTITTAFLYSSTFAQLSGKQKTVVPAFMVHGLRILCMSTLLYCLLNSPAILSILMVIVFSGIIAKNAKAITDI